jgi:hypothetical protein
MPPEHHNHDGREEIKNILLENQRLLIENNQMLHKMRRTAFLGSLLRFIWLVFMLTASVYVYLVYIAPYVDTLKQKIAEIEQMNVQTEKIQDWYDTVRKAE